MGLNRDLIMFFCRFQQQTYGFLNVLPRLCFPSYEEKNEVPGYMIWMPRVKKKTNPWKTSLNTEAQIQKFVILIYIYIYINDLGLQGPPLWSWHGVSMVLGQKD